MNIDRLGLRGVVLEFAKSLAEAHPDVVFTSGMRMRADQARVMADNIARGGWVWVENTYVPSEAKKTIVKWLKQNEFETADAIAIGLSALFDGMTNEQLGRLSRHFTGDAVDVQPVSGPKGNMIKQSILELCSKLGLKFLDREGGLVRWHIQTR